MFELTRARCRGDEMRHFPTVRSSSFLRGVLSYEDVTFMTYPFNFFRLLLPSDGW